MSAGHDAPLVLHHGDNLAVVGAMADATFDLVYIDPPFNTGKRQTRTRLRTTRVADGTGDRVGFKGASYKTEILAAESFADAFDDYLGFLVPRLRQAHRVLAPNGSFFLHIDPRESHYCKVALDTIFGRDCFMNEIVWSYDYGARSKTRWPAKHDVILWYAKDPTRYTFNYDAIDRIPYLAPSLVGPEKAARGKTPTDVWWHTIVSPGGKERTGYPTQKPLGIIERIVRVHSRPGDQLLDFFAGSGTLGEAALEHGRRCVLVDNHPGAITVMRKRLARFDPVVVEHPATP